MATRGVRNNNPGNIRRSRNLWDGMTVLNEPDSEYCQFTSPEFGIRAMGKLLGAYQDSHHLDTIRQIIGRWAPPSENESLAYAVAVGHRMKLGIDERVDIHDPPTALAFVNAIIAQENANYVYPLSTVLRGLTMSGILRSSEETEPPKTGLLARLRAFFRL